MQKLSTIQKRENLNAVYKDGAPGPGGAYHDYAVFRSGPLDGESEPLALVLFQKGEPQRIWLSSRCSGCRPAGNCSRPSAQFPGGGVLLPGKRLRTYPYRRGSNVAESAGR